MARGQWAGDGGDEKKNCLLSQSHGPGPGNLDSNFSFVWFRLGGGLQWERRCISIVQAFLRSSCALSWRVVSCSWWVLVTNFDPGTSIE